MSVHSSRSRQYRRNRALVLAVSDLCWLCGLPGADTADHCMPKSRGGTDDVDNLRPAHFACNARRGDARATLRTTRRW